MLYFYDKWKLSIFFHVVLCRVDKSYKRMMGFVEALLYTTDFKT